MRYLITFAMIFFLWTSCSQKNQNNTSSTATSVEDALKNETNTPPQKPAETKATDEFGYLDLQLKGTNTPDINLKDLKGEVIFLNYWGSWCYPCRMEMPSIQSLYDTYKDKVKFVMVAQERRPGAHIPYLEKEGFTFPVYEALTPIDTQIKPKGFPTTIIIDKQGNVKVKDVGAANWNSDSVHKLIDKLLAE